MMNYQVIYKVTEKAIIRTSKRSASYYPISSTSRSGLRLFGMTITLAGITGVMISAPLDALEKVELKNECYHHHLHPR